MVWDIKTSCGYESDKICSVAIHYLTGKGLDIGCGMRKVWPQAIGIDNKHHFGQMTAANIEGDGQSLPLFADNSLDYIFSSHTLEHFYEEKIPSILAEWARVIKPGGYLVLYVPSANFYPLVGQEGANPDHKWNIYPGDVEKHLKAATTCGWTQLEKEERSKTNEYSLYLVFQKRTDGVWEEKIWERNPEGKKRCLVIRYGAIGDQIMVSSILPGLKKQGYHITYNTTPEGKKILEHDPHIDEWMLQDRDQVPNPSLGSYWATLAMEDRWDRIVNLCESVEGGLLTLPDKITHQYTDSVRRKLYNVNYLERTHDIAGVGYKFAQKFYSSDAEKEWAKKLRQELTGGAPVIVWAINGSSAHKVYPFSNIVIAWLLQKTDAHVFLVSDPGVGVQLQNAIIKTIVEDGGNPDRIHGMGGKWEIRQSLTFLTTQADVVVGPETGPLNAAAFEEMQKVIYLSHSSHENLTKHWVNTRVLTPPSALCPCYPCHRLHYTWEYCHKVEDTAAALCASNIKQEKLFEKVMEALDDATKGRKAA